MNETWRFIVIVCLLVAVGTLLPFAANAAEGQSAPPPEQTLPEVKVRAVQAPESPVGPDEGYAVKRSGSGTKTDTPLLETPQSITVITRKRIEEQGATSLQDALNYAAGVRSDAYGLDSRSDNVRVRGGYPDEYRDGLRRLFGYYTSNTRADVYLLERIEVLRGPTAMLYGMGSTAGVLNMVSKRPQPEEFREVGVQFGSFGRKQLQADLTGPLSKDGDLQYRLVMVGRDSGTQVDFVADDRVAIAPSLTWRPSAATSVTFLASFQDDHSGSTSQFFPFSGTLLPNPNGRIPTNRFIGNPGIDRYDSRRAEGGWLFEHKLNEAWTFRQNFRVADNEVEYFTAYADSFSNPSAPYIDPAERVLNRYGYFEHRKGRITTADQNLEGRFQTGALRHQLLAGVDVVRFRENSRAAGDDSIGGTLTPIDVYNPVYAPYTPPPLTANPKSTLRGAGVYLQDQVKIGERLILVGGVRRDHVTSGLEGAPDNDDRETTLRAGAMYKIGAGLAPYVSYSESFTPIAGTNLAGVRWKPMRGEQIEAGVKWEPAGKRLLLTAAVYDLKEKFRQIPDPNNPLDQVQAGSTRTTGVELEAAGHVLPWLDIAAHYNQIDIDPQLEGMPEHQFGVWNAARFAIGDTPGFVAGLGMRWMSSFRDGSGPVIPSLTLFDGMFGYERGPWRYAINVQNLADKTYVATCLARGDCWYGARRTVVVSASYRF
jgi:iron complex outermembrane receptor protein